MSALLGSVLVASFLGSLHCAGMCGGLVVFYSGTGDPTRKKSWPAHIGYHLSRLFSYSLLGAVAGGVGSATDWAGAGLGIGRAAAILAGGAMIGWGLLSLAKAFGVRTPNLRLPFGLERRRSALYAKLASRSPLYKGVAVGLLSVLLPCGWLYAYVLVAAGTAQPLAGAMVMAVFWLGSVPILSGLGVGAQRISLSFRRRLPALGALILVVIGIITLAGRFGPLKSNPIPDPASQEQPQPSPPEEPPCHH